MPRIPVEFAINDFSGGLNNRKDPLLIDRNEATTAYNVDISGGMIRGMKQRTSAYTSGTIPANATFLRYLGTTWVASTTLKSHLYDGSKHYVCDGSGTYIWSAGSTVSLGMAAPATVVAGLAAGGSLFEALYGYAVTFVDDEGNETNPTYVTKNTNVANHTVTISVTPPSNRVKQINLYRPLVSLTDDPSGSYYFLDSVSDPAVGVPYVFADDGGYAQTTATILSWGAGGSSTGSGSTSDHSPAPALELLSTGLHGAVGSLADVNNSIIFGAKDNVVRWNRQGFSAYWPTRCYWISPEDIEALVSHSAQTLVFTTSTIYSATGSNSEQIAFEQTNAAVGCRPGTGKCVVYTPYGVVFLSTRGIEVFDGSSSEVISNTKLSDDYLNGLTPVAAAFLGNKYHLFHSTGLLIMEFTSGGVIFTESSYTATAVTTATVGSEVGLYFCEDLGGAVYKMYGSSNRTTWEYVTGEFSGGSSAFMKRPGRLFVDSVASISVSLKRDGTTISIGSFTSNRGAPKMLRFKAGTNSSLGQRFSLSFSGNAATTELHEVRIVGE